MTATKILWIGLAEVVTDGESDVLKKGDAAFVPVVAKATDAQEFYKVVKDELKTLQLELIGLEDVEHLSERRRKHTLPDDLETAIHGLSSAHGVALETFQVFRNSNSGQQEVDDRR
jgi:hypothetical protein